MGLMSKEVTVSQDEGMREGTTKEGISGIKPAIPGGVISAGNASQFSDGGGAVVVMDETLAQKKGLQPLGRFLGFAVAGCEPDEMGIGPVFAVPRLLERAGLSVDDIGLWELNEAFAVQVVYCRDKLGIPDELLNVDGGAVAVGVESSIVGCFEAPMLLRPGGLPRGEIERVLGHALLQTRDRAGEH